MALFAKGSWFARLFLHLLLCKEQKQAFNSFLGRQIDRAAGKAVNQLQIQQSLDKQTERNFEYRNQI